MTPEILRQRREICSSCEFYSLNVCKKGHILSSWLGCPVKKFTGFNNFGYAANRVVPEVKLTSKKCASPSCGSSLQKMSWLEVLTEFHKTISEWHKLGYPMADPVEHDRRFNICKVCDHYRHFQCAICKCAMFVKCKLGNARCYDIPPRW